MHTREIGHYDLFGRLLTFRNLDLGRDDDDKDNANQKPLILHEPDDEIKNSRPNRLRLARIGRRGRRL